MKVSLNWIKQFTNFSLPDTAELVARIGAQLGAVEEVIELGPQYAGALVVRVVECQKHDDSDHLNVCKIDDGGVAQNVDRDQAGLVQVVCGAPNVREGIMVVWLPPGVTVPDSYGKEPLVLEARKLRGVISNGMLASPRELALGDSHEGLLIIHQEVKPGTGFADLFELNDTIIDIENKMFTHRPDCFGQLGVAREIAGILGYEFHSPSWYSAVPTLPNGEGLPITVVNELTEVPRFMAIALKEVIVTASPVWLQTYLARVGVRPINNVVDVTNYLMLVTGQPLHAYDYDKVKAHSKSGEAELTVRYPKVGETLKLLNGKTIAPREQAVLITSGGQPIGLGGVMGGSDTEVDDHTTNIIVEVASFDMYSIRRTAMAHGIFSEAVTRFNKGQSPLQNDRILTEAVRLLGENAGAVPASPVYDVHQALTESPAQNVRTDFINSRLGLNLTTTDIIRLLKNVEFEIYDMENLSQLFIQSPFWRTDVLIPEDVVEEVGRLYGFDKLPLELPRRSLTPVMKDPLLTLKSAVRTSLAKAGANEVLTYSFVHGNLLEKVGQNPAQAFSLGNALSPDLQYYRLSLIPSLLDRVHANSKAGYDQFALYELGKTHTTVHQTDGVDGLPQEFDVVALVYTARDKVAPAGAAYYQVQQFVQQLTHDLGADVAFLPITDHPDAPIVQPYELSRSAYVVLTQTNEFLGIVGEFSAPVRQKLKLPDHTAGFELSLLALLAAQTTTQRYEAQPRYPVTEQDISLKVPAEVSYQTVYEFVAAQVAAAAMPQTKITITPVDIYQRPDDLDHKQITLRLRLASYEKTLTDHVVNQLLDTIAAAAQASLHAERL